MPRPVRLAAVLLTMSILAMLGIAVALAPARYAVALLPDPVAEATFDWRGTIWRGSVALAPPIAWLPTADAGHLAWRLVAVQPIAGRLVVDASLRGPLHALRGRAELGSAAQTVTGIHGEVDLALLASLLARYDIILGGTLDIEDLGFIRDGDGARVTTGRLHWEGGTVQYRLTGDWQRRRLPPLEARIVSANRLQVADLPGTPLIDLALGHGGWVQVTVRRHLLDLLDMPWDAGESPEAVVMVLEERLL